METKNTANEKDSMPTNHTVAVESNPQQPSNPVKALFSVPLTASVRISLSADVEVEAIDAEEAAEKVQAQIYTGTLADDLEVEVYDSCYIVSAYGLVKSWPFDVDFQIVEESIDLAVGSVDPWDVLVDEIGKLEESISWNAETLTKHKAFLESLLETAVDFQIDKRSIELLEGSFDPSDVLEAEIKQLEESISWNARKLTKQKAFLESLIETAVAA
jgi:uncharacterized protein YdhG (YjbR/CyaY superfamily)